MTSGTRFANPYKCRCVYVGGSKEYAAYQHLVTERQIAAGRIWARGLTWTRACGARVLAMKALGFGVALMLVATAVSGPRPCARRRPTRFA